MVSTNQKIRRLPGFRFETHTPARENILPRMDIALFVGFAASGPIGVPVALESAVEFERIFGRDLPLVSDGESGDTVCALLPAAVRAFFRNGGRRCWIIRTARERATKAHPLNCAAYNFFPLSGVAGVQFQNREINDIAPAFARARSKGSWSDDLQIGAATLARAAEFVDLNEENGRKVLTLEVAANDAVKRGELLRLTFSDENLVLMLAADEIVEAKNQSPPLAGFAGKIVQKIASNRFVWLENLPNISSPESAENVWVRFWTRANEPDAPEFLPVFQAELNFQTRRNQTSSPKIRLKFTNLSPAEAPPAGSLLAAVFRQKPLFLQVETVSVNDSGEHESVEIVCRGVFCLENAAAPNSTPTVERLTFELWLKNGDESLTKLSDLAFNGGHERFWGSLPTDADLYRLSDEKNAEHSNIFDWTQANDAATFPLAGGGVRDAFYFPIFPVAAPENYLGALSSDATKLQRDGLEVFDEPLFLDEKLKNVGLNNLLNEAEFVRYLSPRPRPLSGIHAALASETVIAPALGGQPDERQFANLSLEEATIISVPEAVQRGWFRTKNEAAILSPPVSAPPLRPAWWTFQDCRKPDVKPVSEPLWGNFLDCRTRVLEMPTNLRVKGGKKSAGKFVLEWDYAVENENLTFVLEESAAANFDFAQEIYRGKRKEFAVGERAAGFYFYRVRAETGGDFSDWSVGLPVEVAAAENWVAKSAARYEPDVLLAIQTALLRMCAARGDLFAVLDLPEHYEKDAALNHVAALKSTKGFAIANRGVEAFSADEARAATSFGAVYHPWLATLEDGFESARSVPPGGAISGVMARRAVNRGVWVAPANEILQGALGLSKTFARESFLDFQDASINLVRHEPDGLTALSAETLSDEFDLRSINVRRLLSLLRRLALKHGAEYVFEPNDERFRRSVERGFASLLDFMFERGAFAGATPAKSYQVSVNGFLNDARAADAGRFTVELRVAPSLPLKFVNVRLIQAGGRGTVTEVF